MYTPPKEEDLHPIYKARRLRNDLGVAIYNAKWKRAHNIAQDLIRQIDLCIADPTPQLDGLFKIGIMWYENAPEKSKHMIDHFNNKLKIANRRLPQ